MPVCAVGSFIKRGRVGDRARNFVRGTDRPTQERWPVAAHHVRGEHMQATRIV